MHNDDTMATFNFLYIYTYETKKNDATAYTRADSMDTTMAVEGGFKEGMGGPTSTSTSSSRFPGAAQISPS